MRKKHKRGRLTWAGEELRTDRFEYGTHQREVRAIKRRLNYYLINIVFKYLKNNLAWTAYFTLKFAHHA